MDGEREREGRRLRAVERGGAITRAAIETAVVEAVGGDSRGLPLRALGPAVADRLGVAPAAVGAEALQSVIGLLIATGRLDEADGRLLRVDVEERRAG